MTVDDLIKQLQKWNGTMRVVLLKGDCESTDISAVDWADTDPEAVIVLSPVEELVTTEK